MTISMSLPIRLCIMNTEYCTAHVEVKLMSYSLQGDYCLQSKMVLFQHRHQTDCNMQCIFCTAASPALIFQLMAMLFVHTVMHVEHSTTPLV